MPNTINNFTPIQTPPSSTTTTTIIITPQTQGMMTMGGSSQSHPSRLRCILPFLPFSSPLTSNHQRQQVMLMGLRWDGRRAGCGHTTPPFFLFIRYLFPHPFLDLNTYNRSCVFGDEIVLTQVFGNIFFHCANVIARVSAPQLAAIHCLFTIMHRFTSAITFLSLPVNYPIICLPPDSLSHLRTVLSAEMIALRLFCFSIYPNIHPFSPIKA